ncbi:MAG: hypothetical protein VST67_03820, partial [Nitrospirota bacterium]|nr:hypothetical protein [Nitrospirota bacterium]
SAPNASTCRPARTHRSAERGRARDPGPHGEWRLTTLACSIIELLGKMVSCPRDSDAYLRTLYGNYTEVDYTYVDNEVAHTRRNVDEAEDA